MSSPRSYHHHHYRVTATGTHENGDTYDYKIGICAEPSPKNFPGCAVVQEKRVEDQLHQVCLGRLNATTVLESKMIY